MNAAHVGQGLTIHNVKLTEIALKWSKTVLNVIFISVTSDEEKNAD